MASVTEQQNIVDEIAIREEGPSYLPALRLLWERRRFLGRCAGIGLVLATLIAFTIPKQWQSTVQLMPPDPQSLSGPGALAVMAGAALPSAAAGLAGNLMTGRTAGAVFLAIMRSRTAQDELINRFNLREVYGLKRYEDTRKLLTKRTSADEDRKSGVITIAVTDRDPKRARDLAAAYVSELDKLVAALSTSSARRQRVFLEERLKTVKQDLDEASRELGQFSSRSGTLDLQTQGKAMLEAAAKLQGELIAAQSELRGLEAVYSDNNVRVRALRARVGELRGEMQKMGGTSAENGVELPAGEVSPSLRKLPLLATTYGDLYRRAKIQETVFEILTKQYELAKVEEAKEIPTVRVLDSPQIPERKTFPPRLIIMVLGMMLALTLAATWVLGEKMWKGTDGQDSRKLFLTEIATCIRNKMTWRRFRSVQ